MNQAMRQVHKVRGVCGTVADLCAHFQMVSVNRASKRIAYGWTVEQAVCTPNTRGGK